MFSYCPTEDVATDQGVLILRSGKQLFVDGSGGSGGTVNFNGVFSTPYFARNLEPVGITNVATAGTAVWAVGSNSFGTLGLGDDTSLRSSPEILPSPTNIVQVSVAGLHTMFLDEDGRVRRS